MDKIKKTASDFKYELAVAGILLFKLLCERIAASPMSLLLVACQYCAAALLTARFIKSADGSERRLTQGFAALCLVLFITAYNSSLLSFAGVNAMEHIGILLFFAAFYCLSFSGLAIVCVPLAAAGAALDLTFAVTCLPVLIAVTAFAGGAPAVRKSNRQKKRESKNGGPGVPARMAALDKFTSPLLLVLLTACAVKYLLTYDRGLGMFYADSYYIRYNLTALLYFVPFIAAIGAIMYFARGNRRVIRFFAALLAACVLTAVLAFLFDLGITHFKLYRMCAACGAISGIFALASRRDEFGADLRETACAFIKKAYPFAIAVSLCAFCVTMWN